jgi:hypothetical protein
MTTNKLAFTLAVLCFLAHGFLCRAAESNSTQEAPSKTSETDKAAKDKSLQEAIELLEEYLRKDAEGLRSRKDGSIGLQEYVEWGDEEKLIAERREGEPVWEIRIVIANYKIVGVNEKEGEAIIDVRYEMYGALDHGCGNETGMFTKAENLSEDFGNNIPDVWVNPNKRFILRKYTSGKWLIHEPMIPPHVYKDVVVRNLEENPEIKEFYFPGCYDKTIKALKSLP